MKFNMKRIWETPIQVPLDEIPFRTTLRESIYDDFRDDVLKQMERALNVAICYPFPNVATAQKYHKCGLMAIRKVKGKSAVRAKRDGTNLYVWRGPNWS